MIETIHWGFRALTVRNGRAELVDGAIAFALCVSALCVSALAEARRRFQHRLT